MSERKTASFDVCKAIAYALDFVSNFVLREAVNSPNRPATISNKQKALATLILLEQDELEELLELEDQTSAAGCQP